MSDDTKFELTTSRRDTLKLGLLGLVNVLPVSKAFAMEKKGTGDTHQAVQQGQHTPHIYLYFNQQEAEFIEAAVARLIPKDESGGGAIEANVPRYLDLQLGGSWGAGERLYRSGPWRPGTKQQGYQLPFTPGEFFHVGLKAILKEFQGKTAFHRLSPEHQDAYLQELEKSDRDLNGIPANTFFAHLLGMTIEGFLADPVYGGNRDMISWRMIGFPGAGASYAEIVDKHGILVNRKPISLAEDAGGHVHLNPNIPATIPGK